MSAITNDAAWRHVRNVLAVRLDNMGDVLMTTPAISALKQSAPDMRVTLLASRGGAAVREHLPVVDEVIVYDAPWVRGGRAAPGGLNDRRLLSRLARHAFDAAVIFTGCEQSALPAALMCRLAGIPLRLAHCRENPHDLLTHWVPDNDVCQAGMRHEVTRQLDLVRAVGFHPRSQQLTFHGRAIDVLSMRRKFQMAGGDLSRPYFVVHPGAAAASRRYPPERFGAAADVIAKATGCQAVFTGGSDEHALVARAQQAVQLPSLSLAGQLTLGELGSLISGAQVVVCNNSGPAHLAAAQGTPVVVLYALTHPQHTPWRVPSRVLNREVPCANCLQNDCPQLHHDCLLGVDAKAVAEAALELVGAPPAVRLPRAAAAMSMV